MTGSDSPMALDDAVLDRIEAALSESARGRHFLEALGRRRRDADTERLLAAIARLERSVAVAPAAAPDPTPGGADPAEAGAVARLRAERAEMAATLAGCRTEIGRDAAAGKGNFEGLLRASERTTAGILAAAEAIQEAGWSLRETGTEAALCDALDRHAVAITVACAEQDVNAQRLARLARTLDLLEERLAGESGPAPALVQAPLQSPLPAPLPLPDPAEALAFRPAANAEAGAAEPVGTRDRDQERDRDPKVTAGPVGTAAAGPGAADDLAAAFPDLDHLSIEEKIALFS